MISLGQMRVRDADSIVEIRMKILGLARALAIGDVRATRIATAVSEYSRACAALGGTTEIDVSLVPQERAVELRLAWRSTGELPEPARLGAFFDNVAAQARAATVVASLETPLAGLQIDGRFAARERERIQHKSRGVLLDELRETNRQLEIYNETLEETVAQRTAELRAANLQMRRTLDAGARYVRSLIPAPMAAPLEIEWEYIPSSDLGGDTIGYHWLDDRHLALYLIDVTGHGLDSALLAVTVINVLRSGALPDTDMRQPEQVLASLNDLFQSDRHANKFFTIWYGVYEAAPRRLAWSAGGHHPSLLHQPADNRIIQLDAGGPLIGVSTGMEYTADSVVVEPGARLLVFSDGVFEILRDGRLVWSYQKLLAHLDDVIRSEPSLHAHLLEHVRALRGCDQLEDDFSVMEICFP